MSSKDSSLTFYRHTQTIQGGKPCEEVHDMETEHDWDRQTLLSIPLVPSALWHNLVFMSLMLR